MPFEIFPWVVGMESGLDFWVSMEQVSTSSLQLLASSIIFFLSLNRKNDDSQYSHGGYSADIRRRVHRSRTYCNNMVSDIFTSDVHV